MDIGWQAQFTSMSIHRLRSQNSTQQLTNNKTKKTAEAYSKTVKRALRNLSPRISHDTTRFTREAKTKLDINNSMSSKVTKAVTMKAQRRQRQPQTANIEQGVNLTIKRRRDFGIKPGINCSTGMGRKGRPDENILWLCRGQSRAGRVGRQGGEQGVKGRAAEVKTIESTPVLLPPQSWENTGVPSGEIAALSVEITVSEE